MDKDKITIKMFNIFNQIFANSPDLFEHRIYQKEETLFTSGSIIDNIYFVERGILRTYRYENKIDITSGLYFPDDVIVPFYCMYSFNRYHRKPAILTLQAIEESDVYSISFEKLEGLREEYPDLDDTIANFALRSMETYLLYGNCLAAYKKEDLYDKILKENPAMMQVPDKYMATYIGTDRSYMNRIKNRPYKH